MKLNNKQLESVSAGAQNVNNTKDIEFHCNKCGRTWIKKGMTESEANAVNRCTWSGEHSTVGMVIGGILTLGILPLSIALVECHAKAKDISWKYVSPPDAKIEIDAKIR